MVGVGFGASHIVQIYHEKSMILPDVSRVLACLYEKGIEFEPHTTSCKSLLRLQASSHAPVPFYDGHTFLEESREICRYIAEKYEHHGYSGLLGKDALERASVEQWLHNEEHAFNPPSRALFCHLAFPLDEDDGDGIDIHARKLEEVLEVYEQRLSDSEFLVGNKFTLADLVHMPNSHYIKASDKFLYLYDSRKNVRRWWDAISNRKSWKKVLEYINGVEEQNKQEELKKQQQEKEDPRTSSHTIRMDPIKHTRTEPRTILVSRADPVSSSSIVPQTKKPLPSDVFRNETLVSSSQSTHADKTSAVKSEETTIFPTPQDTPPTPVQSTLITSTKYSIPVQSTKDAASPTPAKKPPIDDASKSSTKDASTLNLDVFDYYPSHTGEETPYIKPTPSKPSETLDAFSGSNIDTGRTSISTKEVPDQSSVSDSYKSDSRATDVDSQFKESDTDSVPTPPELEPTGTSASKLHTTDAHRRLQSEQCHTATTGLDDIKQDDDRLTSTGQGKLRNDVQQYQSQDSEQATSHPVPQEPKSMGLVQGREKITQRPYIDQSREVLPPLPQKTADAREIVKDNASSGNRGALPPPFTQEHGVTPPRQAAYKDAQHMIPSQVEYPGGQDTNKQHRDPSFISTKRPVQDARVTFDESKASDSIISNERFSYASQSSPRKDLDGTHHTTAPFEKRYPGTEDTSKQAKDTISTPWQMTDQDAEDTTEQTRNSDSSSLRAQHSYVQRADAPSQKQETIEDPHSATSAIQKNYANVKDTPGLFRDTDFKPVQTIGQDDQETFRETKSIYPSFLRDQQSGTWREEVNQDGHSVAPPSQTRYQSSTPPSKTSYPIAKDASKQPKKKAAQDDVYTSEESNTADEVASTEQPLNAWRKPVSPRRQELEDSSRANTSLQKRYPYDEEDIQVEDTASVSRKIAPDGGIEETKPFDSTTKNVKPMYTQQSALPPPRQAEVEDDKVRQSRVIIPEPHRMVSKEVQATHDEKKMGTPGQWSSAPARADIHDGHSAEKPYKKYTTDDQKVAPSLLSKEPASQVQPPSEPLQRAAPDGDLPSKTIYQWQRASAPLHGVVTNSGDAEVAVSSSNDQKSRPMSQEARRVNQMGKQSGEQRIKPPVSIEAETSDVGVGHAARSLPDAARTDDATVDDKFAKRSNIDERVGETKQVQAPNTAAHPASAPTKKTTPDSHEAGNLELVSTPESQRLKPAKATQDPATIPEDVHDASLSSHDADTYEKKARYHASGDELLSGSLRDKQSRPPASTQAHPTVETLRASDSSQYLRTGDLRKTELAKPTVIDQESMAPLADPTSMDPHHAGILPADVAPSEQKSAPSDKGSARAAQSLSPIEPIKADSNVSAANYTNVPQKIFQQQARPSAPSIVGIPASDTQGVIGKIQEVTPDSRHTDDSGKPFVPSQGQVSHASQVIPGQEEMIYPPSTRVFPTSDTQVASAEFHEATPDDQHGLELTTPLGSNGKHGSHVESTFESGEVDPAENKLASSDHELAYSAEQHGEPRKEQIKVQPTIIGRQETPDNRKDSLTSEDVLDTTPTHGDVQPTGSIEPARRPLSVGGDEPTSATQAPSPGMAPDFSHTEDTPVELETIWSMKPSTTPDARGITHSTTPGEVAFKHESASSDPSQGDAMVPDQAKDSQTTPGRQDILSTQHPSRNVQENITGDKSGENKPSRPSSSVLEGKSPKVVPASAPGIQLGSAPNEVALEEKKLPPSGQDSAYPAQPPSSAEPRSKDIEYLSPSTQLNSTIEPRNGDAIVAAPDQAKDSQETPGPQLNLPTPSSYTRLPSRKPQEDEPTDNLVEAKSSKPPSVIEEDKPSVAVPVSAPDTQHGQHSPHSVHPSFSAEPTKEDTVIAAIDQTSTMEKIVDQNYMTSDLSKVKTPFSGTHSSRETQKGTRDEKLASQWRVSPDRHVSESPKGLSPEVETLNTIPDSTPIYGDARLNSDDVPAESSLPETQDLQVSASAHNVPADSVGKIKSPRYLSTEQVMAPIMSPTVPSVSPLGAIPGTNSVQVPRPASTVNLESVPETQHGMPQGGATPAEQKNAISDQESAHISELPTSSEPRKEAVNVAAVDQPNVLQGPETTAQHKIKAPSSDAREALQKDQQHSHVVLPSDLHDGPTSEVLSAVVDKETPLLLSQEQTSTAEPNSILTTGDVPPTSSLKKREAEPPAATQAPTSQVPQSSVFAQNDSLGSIDSPRQASTDQVTALMIDSAAPSDAAQGTEPGKAIPDVDSAAPTDAAQGTEPGRNSSQHPPFSTETTKDTVVTANQAEDMHTITHQQAITPAPGTAKTPFPSTQYRRPIQESAPNGGHIDKPRPSQEQVSLLGSMSEPREGQTADPYGTNIDEKINTSSSSQANNSNSRSGLGPIRGDVHPSTGEGPAEIYYPEPGAQTQLPAATQDRSLEPSSKAKSIGQGAKAPTEYLASSPDTQLGSSETQSKAALAKQKIDVSDKKSANAPRSPFSAEPTEGANADQTSGPETTVTNQVASTTPDASDTLGEDQESSRDDHISNSENLLGSKEAASYAGYASEESVDKEMTLPPRETQNSNTGPDSTPYSSDAHLSSTVVPDTSSIQNQNVQPPATRSLTSQAVQGSSPSQIAPDSLEKLDSPRLPSTMEPVTSPAAPLGVPQGTEPGMHSVQPSQEASELSSDEKIPTTQGDQVNTLPNADLSTNQVVGQSEGADFKGINSQWYLKGASTNERNRTQQQTDQFGNQSFKDNNNGADGTVRSNISTTSEEFQKQPSSPRKESSEKPENQQQADQAIVESLESNEKQAEQTKPHDTETIEPEDMEASENTNEKNNRKPLVETLDHSEKQASGVQQLGENTKDAPNSTEDTSGDVQAVSKSEDDSRSSEESKVLQQSEDKNQGGETVAPNSDIGHPIERDLPANSYQHNSSQSQAEAPDKSVQQPSPGIQNKDNNSSRSDGSTDPTKPGYMKD